MMEYITIVGLKYYFGNEVFRVKQFLYLEKDHDNTEDDEAIKVTTEAGVTYGYVANSIYTKAKGTKSAGRIYDGFHSRTAIEVMFILQDQVIAKIVGSQEEISF